MAVAARRTGRCQADRRAAPLDQAAQLQAEGPALQLDPAYQVDPIVAPHSKVGHRKDQEDKCVGQARSAVRPVRGRHKTIRAPRKPEAAPCRKARACPKVDHPRADRHKVGQRKLVDPYPRVKCRSRTLPSIPLMT